MAIPLKIEWDDATSQWVEAKGRPGAATAEWNGFEWVSGKNPEGPGAISRGLTTGIETTKGLLSEALPALLQSALGYDEAAQKNLLQYQERMKKLEESGLGSRVRMGDIEGLGSLLSFAGESLGEAIPSIATALVPGVGLGAAGASTLGRAAVSKAAGKVASTAAETAAKEVARREAAGIAVDASMRAAIEKAALEAAPAAIGRNWGNIAGAALGSAAQNMPETFATIYNETGEMRPEVAGLVGGIKSALDVVTPLQLIKKTRGVDFSERLSDILAGRLLKGRPGAAGAVGGLLESAAFEGLTEGLQETLDQLAVATLADKSVDWHEILEAGLKGTFGGAVPGAAAGYMGGRAKGREAAQLGELKAAQDAEESRQAELQQRYAELGSQPPDYMAGVRSSFVGANPGFRLTPEGEMDRGRMEEEARQRIEAEIPPSQREKALKDYNKYLDKIDLAYQDYIFNATKKREAEVAARQKAQEETLRARAAGEERRAADLEIIQRGNADSSLLRDDAFRQQFDEARQREANRREAAATQRRMDEEELASLGFGDFPPQATPLTTTPTPIPEATRDTLLDAGYRLDQIAAMGPRAESVAKGVRREAGLYTKEEAPKLQKWVRNELEDYLGELKSGQRVSLPVVQKRLKDAGYDASKQEVTDILTQYTSEAESLVPVDASLRLGRNPEDPNVFVKQVGAPAVAPRLKVGEDVGGVQPKGGFEGVTLATEVTRPTTPLQATLQNPPAGLTSRQYEALRNRIIRRDPKATLTKKDLDAAAGEGVQLTQKQAADIWEALTNNGDVKRQGFAGYRVNPEAELSTEYRDEGSPRMDKPKEVKGETLIPKGTRNKLYGLGYTRDDIAGMTTEEAQGIASRREKKSDTREMASSAETPLTLKEAGFRQDNPALRGNLEWLQEKQAQADADYQLTKGMNGSITAEFKNPIELPVSIVSKIPGERGEKRVPGESQFDTLLKQVKKKGWKPEPIYIDVNHRGEAFIYEGNTRVAVAKELGIDRIPVYVRWVNGAELVEGQWSPQNILDIASSKKKTSTREMASDAEMHARNFGGTVAWQEGDLALIKTFSLNGTPIYVPTRGTRFARVNIDMVAPTSTFSAEDIAKLKKIRDRLQAEDKAREATNPQGPFKEGENVVFAGKIKPEIQGILRGWMQMLGLGGQRIVFATPEGAAGMLDLPGKWGRIANLGATLRGQGSSTSLGDGVHVIIIREGMPVVRTLETLAHEMGHILETTALREASPEVRRQIEMEFRNWLATNSPKAARDYMQALRAMRGGRFVDPGNAQIGNDLTFYWKSFGEWFADQVSRWATTQQKPISVVEQFFQRLANVLKNFFTGEKAKFAPNQKVADWLNTLDKVTPPSAGGIPPTREMRAKLEVYPWYGKNRVYGEAHLWNDSFDMRNWNDLDDYIDSGRDLIVYRGVRQSLEGDDNKKSGAFWTPSYPVAAEYSFTSDFADIGGGFGPVYAMRIPHEALKKIRRTEEEVPINKNTPLTALIQVGLPGNDGVEFVIPRHLQGKQVLMPDLPEGTRTANDAEFDDAWVLEREKALTKLYPGRGVGEPPTKVSQSIAGGIAPTREMKNVIEAGKIALGIKPIGRRSLMQGAAAAAGAPDISIAKDVLKQGEVLGEAWVGNGEATGRILGQIFAGKSPLPNLPYEFNLPQGLMEDLDDANQSQMDIDSDESMRGASGQSLHSIRGRSYDLLEKVSREKDPRKKAALKKKVSDFVYEFDDFEASLGSTAYEKRQAILNKIMEYHNTDMWIGNQSKFKNMDMALLQMLFKEAFANESTMQAGPTLTAPAYNEDSSKLYRIGFDRFLEAFIDNQPSGNLETNLRKLEASSILNDPQTFYRVAAEKFLLPYYEMMDSESYLDRLKYTYIPGKPESLTDFNDLDNNTKKSIINRMNELRKTVHNSTNLVRQLATVNMDDMRQIVENLRRYNKQFAATTSQVIAELGKYDSKVFDSPEIKQKLEKFEKELNQISAEVKMEMAAGKPIPRKPGLTILQSGMMQQLESMFPDMGKLNLPKGNKEALEFARRLDADINMQVEMGEPATKPYDCR